MAESKTKEISIQHIVNIIGNYIEKNKVIDIVSASKGIGEVKIDNVLYQIQVILEPNKSKWIEENGVIRTFKKSISWKQKFLNLFTYTMDSGAQK